MGFMPTFMHKRRARADVVLVARAALAGASFEGVCRAWHDRQGIRRVWTAFDNRQSTWGYSRKADAARAYLDRDF